MGDELNLAPDRVEPLIFTQGVEIEGSVTRSEEWARDGETATAMEALATLTLIIQTLGDEAAAEVTDPSQLSKN